MAQYYYDPSKYKKDFSGLKNAFGNLAEYVGKIPGYIEKHDKEIQDRNFKKNTYKTMHKWVNNIKSDPKLWEALKETKGVKEDEKLFGEYRAKLPNPKDFVDNESYKKAVARRTVKPILSDINKAIRTTKDKSILERAQSTIADLNAYMEPEETQRQMESIQKRQKKLTSEGLLQVASRTNDPQRLRQITASAKAQGLEEAASAIETLAEGAKDPMTSKIYKEVADNYKQYGSYEEAFSDVMGKFADEGVSEEQAETIRTAISKLPTELEKTKAWIANMLRRLSLQEKQEEALPETASDVGGFYKKKQRKRQELLHGIEALQKAISGLEKDLPNTIEESKKNTLESKIADKKEKLQAKKGELEQLEEGLAPSTTQIDNAVKKARILINPGGSPLVDNVNELFRKVKDEYNVLKSDSDAWSSFLESLNERDWWRKSQLSPGEPQEPQEPQGKNWDEEMGL